jgi:hypothetical protein
MLYIDDQDCDGAYHLKNYSFIITYLLEDKLELSLGMLDTTQTYCKLPPSPSRDREDPGALPGTLPERGIPAGGLLHHHSRLWSDV